MPGPVGGIPRKNTDNLRKDVNEGTSDWVTFHTGRDYLLPVVSRHQKFIPVVNDDGTVEVNSHTIDDDLTRLVDEFIFLTALAQKGSINAPANSVGKFYTLVRKLILANYDLSNAEIIALLSMDGVQLGKLYSNILKHILKT